MSTLKQLRRKAVQKLQTDRQKEAQISQKKDKKPVITTSSAPAPSAVVKPSIPAGPDPKIKELENQIALQDAQLKALRTQIADLSSRKIEVDVQSGSVEVNTPERPTSLTIEFDDGRMATVTPNYDLE